VNAGALVLDRAAEHGLLGVVDEQVFGADDDLAEPKALRTGTAVVVEREPTRMRLGRRQVVAQMAAAVGCGTSAAALSGPSLRELHDCRGGAAVRLRGRLRLFDRVGEPRAVGERRAVDDEQQLLRHQSRPDGVEPQFLAVDQSAHVALLLPLRAQPLRASWVAFSGSLRTSPESRSAPARAPTTIPLGARAKPRPCSATTR
jgi:hypothetical protein